MVTQPDNFYAPPKSVVEDQPGGVAFLKASRGSRLGAWALDLLVYVVLFGPFLVLSMRQIPSRNAAPDRAALFGGLQQWMLLAGLFFLGITVVNVVLLYRNGQTIGKKLVGIKIVRADGSRASFARIFWLRGFVNALPGIILGRFGGLYAIVDALLIFGEARRCCHDYIADTIVVQA